MELSPDYYAIKLVLNKKTKIRGRENVGYSKDNRINLRCSRYKAQMQKDTPLKTSESTSYNESILIK
jgi:hypothetical protein